MPTHNPQSSLITPSRRAPLAHGRTHAALFAPTRTRPPARPTPPRPTLVSDDAGERQRTFWQLSVAERVASMRRGELTLQECCAWAARAPDEVPLLDGEFEFIAAHMADLDPD
jgi:hypothetical protein